MTNDVVSAFIERWKTKAGLEKLLPAARVFDGSQGSTQPPYAIVRRPFGAIAARWGAGHRRDDITLDVELVSNDHGQLKQIAAEMMKPAPTGFDLDRWIGYRAGQDIETEVLPHAEEKDDETGQWHFMVAVLVHDNVR